MGCVCTHCGITKLSQYNPSKICSSCQKKRTDLMASGETPHYDVKGLAYILGFKSEESVRRWARARKLPPRVPGRRPWLWFKETIHEWLEQWQMQSSGSNWILSGNNMPWSNIIQAGAGPVTPSSTWVTFPQPFPHTPVVVATGVDVLGVCIPKIEPGSFLWTSQKSGSARWLAA